MTYDTINYENTLSLLKEGNYITVEMGELPFICDDNTHKIYVVETSAFFNLLDKGVLKSDRVDFTIYFSLKEELQN